MVRGLGRREFGAHHAHQNGGWRWPLYLVGACVIVAYTGYAGQFFKARGDSAGGMLVKVSSVVRVDSDADASAPAAAPAAAAAAAAVPALKKKAVRKAAAASAAVPRHRASEEDGDDTCHGSWVLRQINASAYQLVEEVNAEWYDNLPTILEQAYDKASPKEGYANEAREPEAWDRFDPMMPTVAACSMSKLGLKDWDGGKLVCGVKDIPDNEERPCIIYSLGSADHFDFEEDAYRETSCTIHTFDCTAKGTGLGEQYKDRIHFHKICMGNPKDNNETANKIFMPLKEIMTMLGHDYVTLLKADIEGFEYKLFNELLLEDDVELPEQISFELHYESLFPELTWKPRRKTAGEMALLSERLYQAGYRIISREDNQFCKHCTELTIARFRCPKGPRSMKNKILQRERAKKSTLATERK